MAFKYYIVSLLFFLPALMYFSWSASHGRDAFKFLNVPIKNANEWYREGWFLSFNGRSRTDVVSELVERKADISPVLLVKRTGWNFYNLWSPNSYPIARLFHDDTVHHPGIWAFWIAAFYILIICAALFELCLSASSDFKLYVMTNVLILSSMGTVWWLVSRYRTSFLFMFVLFAAQAMLKPFPMMRLSQNRRAAVVFFLLIGLMVHMAFSRMGLIGEWS